MKRQQDSRPTSYVEIPHAASLQSPQVCFPELQQVLHTSMITKQVVSKKMCLRYIAITSNLWSKISSPLVNKFRISEDNLTDCNNVDNLPGLVYPNRNKFPTNSFEERAIDSSIDK